MLEHNSNIFTSNSDLIYVDNVTAIKDITKTFLKPNNIIVSSYNYDFEKNYKKYSGISYEMYYVTNNSYIQQLSYYVNEGNGLYINKDYNLSLNYDNKTIKTNSNNELYVDTKELTCAYNDLCKGILRGENKLFYDHNLNNSGFIVSNDGTLKLSNGLLMSLYEINDYYDKFDKLSLDINKLAIKLNYEVDLFDVGDILYKDKNNKLTKLSKGNTPYLICVIASNTLSDNCARFIPINHNNIPQTFARNNTNLYYKKLFSYVPVYEDNLNLLTSSSNIVESKFGYISTDNPNWSNNFKNPFDYSKRYFANYYTIKSNIIWYMDPDTFHKSDMYSIDKKAIVTELINLDKFEDKEICPLVKIEFSDGFIGYYLLNFEYSTKNARFELSEGSETTTTPLLLINKINELVDDNQSSKIKYNIDSILNQKDVVEQYKIYLANESNSISQKSFENSNIDSIDYKILVEELKNKKNTITTTTTTTKSKTTTEDVVTYNTTYEEVWEEPDDDALYESEHIVNENGTVSITYRKKEATKTLVPVYNTVTTQVEKTEYYDEEETTYSYETVYTYKLIIAPGLCDRSKAYLLVQLGDSSDNLSDEMYLEYDNSTGLEYVFTNYQSTISTGYIKIMAYASSKYLDINPIDLGINSITGYQDSFKCVYLSKEKFSFEFNLNYIIPVNATIYKNYSVLTLNDHATILESNDYDDFNDALEYTLDLNYSKILNTEDIEDDNYVEPELSETTTEITTGTTTKVIKESTQSPKEEIISSSTVSKKEESTSSTNNIVKTPSNVETIDIRDNVNADINNKSLIETETESETESEIEVSETETSNQIENSTYVEPNNLKPRIIPGGIIIPLKKYHLLINEIYIATVELRNTTGKNVKNRYKFRRLNNSLVLAEDIPVPNTEYINKIQITNLQDRFGNLLNVKFRNYGVILNNLSTWEDLHK